MPFDGIYVLPGSPLARLLEADRKLTAERRAAAKLREENRPACDKISAACDAGPRIHYRPRPARTDLLHGGHILGSEHLPR